MNTTHQTEHEHPNNDDLLHVITASNGMLHSMILNTDKEN